MIIKTKGNKKIFIFFASLLLIGLVYLSYSFIAESQTNFQKDSDYDGLTDKAEINIYHTNPLKADSDSDGYLDSVEVLNGSNPLNPNDPASALLSQTKQTLQTPLTSQNQSSLPWYIARAAGIVAYLLMFFVVILGVGMTTSYIYKYINPVQSWLIHKYLSLALGIALLTHITALLFDNFIGLRLNDLLVPFTSNYRPILLGLGIIGFYILLVIIFTSIFFLLKYKRTWRFVHYFVYLLFTLSLIHGLFIGTDSNTLVMKIIYYSTGLIFVSLLIYRFVIDFIKKFFGKSSSN